MPEFVLSDFGEDTPAYRTLEIKRRWESRRYWVEKSSLLLLICCVLLVPAFSRQWPGPLLIRGALVSGLLAGLVGFFALAPLLRSVVWDFEECLRGTAYGPRA